MLSSERKWSAEERKRAALQVDEVMAIGKHGYNPGIISLQCELNALRKEMKEARKLLSSHLEMFVDCNTQDPDMQEDECPEGYTLECGRCEAKHEIQRFLQRNAQPETGVKE